MEIINLTKHSNLKADILDMASLILKICPLLDIFKITLCTKTYIESNIPKRQDLIDSINDTPLSYFIEEKNPEIQYREAYIIIDDDLCSKLKFDNRDILGAIAHEFGHLIEYFTTKHNTREDIEQEIYADAQASNIGYKTELISAINKMEISGIFGEDIISSLKKRQLWLKL